MDDWLAEPGSDYEEEERERERQARRRAHFTVRQARERVVEGRL